MALSGLEGVGRCEPGECTSHRNRHSDRRFLFRPADEDKWERKEWAQGSFTTENESFINVSGDSSSVNQTHSVAIQMTFQSKQFHSSTPHVAQYNLNELTTGHSSHTSQFLRTQQHESYRRQSSYTIACCFLPQICGLWQKHSSPEMSTWWLQPLWGRYQSD